jgi:hypothetical protein
VKRRGFVTALAAGLAAARPRRADARQAVTVDATPTLFHGHPDGLTTLVRFTASGLDAPAGRLRVHDVRTGTLIGTAGMIRRDAVLTGELWLPLPARRRVRSALETPGRPTPIRSIHELTPTPRWTIYWLTLASPDAVRAAFTEVPDLMRGVHAAAMDAAGVRVNPWRALPPGADHLDLVRLTVPAAAASRATGIPLARLALYEGPLPPHGERALRGAAVPLALPRAQVVDPRALDLSAGRAAAAGRVEAWLRARAAADPGSAPIAVAVGSDLPFAIAVQPQIHDWNTAYAFPRFAVGDGDEVIRGLAAAAAAADPSVGAAGPATPAPRAPTVPDRDPSSPFLALCLAAAPAEPTLEGLARRFTSPLGGQLVFNPSPFGRSDVVAGAEGGARVVTDVPGLGYAFVPDAPASPPTRHDHQDGARGGHFSVRLESEGGGIASLVHRATGTELVAAGRAVNALPGASLTAVHAETLDGTGTRVVARRVTARDIVRTTVTVYDDLPWVEIENQMESGAAAPSRAWAFDFAPTVERIVWEVPGGTAEAAPPYDALSPIRWTALRSEAGTILLGADPVTTGAAHDAGRVSLRAPGTCRFRIGYHRGLPLPDDPWRFGFGMLPLVAVPVDGRGDRRLPTFGRILDVVDPTVAVLAIRPAEDGVGVMVFLQELAGVGREVPVRPALLAFDGAVLTDLAERDLRPAPDAPGSGVLVPLESLGYAAVRLLGVRLAS